MSLRHGFQPIISSRPQEASVTGRAIPMSFVGREHEARVISNPVYGLPAEVLGEVLLLVISRDGDELPYTVAKDELKALQLVCKSWRHVALLTHQLWAVLAVFDDQLQLEKIVTWFSRAGNLPKKLIVALRYHANCTVDQSGCDLTSQTLARLLAEGPLLHHFHLQASGTQCFRDFMDSLQSLSKPVPRSPRPWDFIQALTLNFTHRWTEHSSRPLFEWIPSTVTSFQLRCPNCPPEPTITLESISTTALHSLTSFTLLCTQIPSPVLGVLKHCVNIVTLTLDLGYREEVEVQDSDIQLAAEGLSLPRIRTLNLENVTRHGVHFLPFLKTPNLENLKIGFHFRWTEVAPPPFEEAILRFINRQSNQCEATLRRLHLDGLNLDGSSEQVSDVLLALPHLTHLTLGYVSSLRREPKGFFDTLLSRASLHGMLCLPQLEVLELFNYPLGDFEDLCLFLKVRRWDRSTPPQGASSQATFERSQDTLRELTWKYYPVDGRKDYDLESFEIVKALRRSGVLVDIGPFSEN